MINLDVGYKPKLHSWRHSDDGNSEWANIDYRGIQGYVMDCDGDGSLWSVHIAHPDTGKEIRIASGENFECGDIYHMDLAIKMVEGILFVVSGDLDGTPKTKTQIQYEWA